jgi:hypothetical protein
MSSVLASTKKPIKGPGLKAAGVVILQFLLVFLVEALEYMIFKVGLWTGIALLVSYGGGLYLGRKGTSLTNAVNPPIAFLFATLIILATIGGAGFHPGKIGLEFISALSGVAPYMVIGSVIAWLAHFSISKREKKSA